MKKLRIAQIAPLWFSVPPKKYGGVERIAAFLCDGLTKKGHKVTLFASGDSKTKAKLVPLIEKGVIPSGGYWGDYWWNPFNHSVAFGMAKDFDIIHCHWGIMGAYFQQFVKTPVIYTMHNISPAGDLRWKVFDYYKKELNLVFISKSEKKSSPIRFKNSWIIYNGIDMKPFKFNPKPKDHLIWIARVHKEKGIENAIEIAKKTKHKLIMAGQIQPQMKKYFEKKIKPLLGTKIKFIGELSQEQLPAFYGQAKACLYPIEWEEPFGLVMVESMAAGTPVIGFKRGAVPEVIKDGKTGFVVDTVPQAIEALGKIGQIERADCHKRVEENFSSQKMVDEYEKVYFEILRKQK